MIGEILLALPEGVWTKWGFWLPSMAPLRRLYHMKITFLPNGKERPVSFLNEGELATAMARELGVGIVLV